MSSLLIVDDQDIVRQGIRKMLEEFDLGITPIYEAGDGMEALILAKRYCPDIILADIMMPEMDGLTFVDELRSMGSKAHVVIISAHSEFEYARKAIALKVDNYILKPVTRRELYKALISLLDGLSPKFLYSQEGARLNYNINLLHGTLDRQDAACDTNPMRSSQVVSVSIDLYGSVVKAFCSGDKEELGREIDDLFFRLGTSGSTLDKAKEILKELVKALHANLMNNKPKYRLSDEYMLRFVTSPDFLSLKAVTKALIEKLYEDSQQEQIPEVVSPVIREVLQYFSQNYGKNISLAYIANRQNINYNYLSSLFTKVMGISFSDYLLKFRLEKAIELLRGGRYKVQEVSAMVGFNDSKYFCRAFKKHFGHTPSDVIPRG